MSCITFYLMPYHMHVQGRYPSSPPRPHILGGHLSPLLRSCSYSLSQCCVPTPQLLCAAILIVCRFDLRALLLGPWSCHTHIHISRVTGSGAPVNEFTPYPLPTLEKWLAVSRLKSSSPNTITLKVRASTY